MGQKSLKLIWLTVTLCFPLAACSGPENTGSSGYTAASEAAIISETTGLSAEAPSQTPDLSVTEKRPPEPEIIETDLSSYFSGHNASAVFYNTGSNQYEIYNPEAAHKQSSPCSTFKIVSSLAALEYGVITPEDSHREWSGEQFWNEAWNTDISLTEAFKTSCIWYYRELINEIGQEKMQDFIDKLEYGNRDISDWEGRLNKNNSNRALTGFWVESSLMISPIEQVDLLRKIFENDTDSSPQNVAALKEIMKVEQNKTNINIYGKTGYGKLNNLCLDAWFIGMFEVNSEMTYFAVHFSETEDPSVTSALAKEVALQIIADRYEDDIQ